MAGVWGAGASMVAASGLLGPVALIPQSAKTATPGRSVVPDRRCLSVRTRRPARKPASVGRRAPTCTARRKCGSVYTDPRGARPVQVGTPRPARNFPGAGRQRPNCASPEQCRSATADQHGFSKMQVGMRRPACYLAKAGRCYPTCTGAGPSIFLLEFFFTCSPFFTEHFERTCFVQVRLHRPAWISVVAGR